MIPVRRLGHVTFETPDIEKQIDHYTRIVGLTVTAQEKDRAVLATHLGEEVLVLERGPRERTTAVSFQVDADFETARRRKILQDHGIRSEARTNISNGIESATVFNDPNGTRVELFSESKLLSPSDRIGAAPIKIGHVGALSGASAQSGGADPIITP